MLQITLHYKSNSPPANVVNNLCISTKILDLYSCKSHRYLPLIDYVGVRLYLRTAATNGPTVHPPGDKWAWTAIMMMPSGDNYWLVRQSSLTVLPAETSGASRRNGRRSENFAYQHLKYLKGSLTFRKIWRHGTSGFTSHAKEGVLRDFISIKIPSPRPVWNRDPWVQWQAH
jgi:hypothetical protein